MMPLPPARASLLDPDGINTSSLPHSVHGLLLPASAERPVELDQALVLGATRLRECEFGGKEGALAVQNFEICGGASLVAHVGQADRFLQIRDGFFLAHPDLMKFLIAD